jgi:NitT/TauT family transport system substrate-binding protein
MSLSKPLRLYENLRTVSYAPFYLAEALRLYAAEGLEVETVTSPRPSETAQGLLEGRVDVAWGGPMRVLMYHDRDAQCPLVCFAQVVGRDPFMLLGREPRPQFRLEDLAGLRAGIVSEVPTPWMTLQDDLGRAGMDPQDVQQGPARTMAQNVAALAAGELDVIQVMEPHASNAVADGIAHLWHRASVRGEVAFTTFYASREFVQDRPEICLALTRALRHAVQRLYAMPADEVAQRLGDWFPDTRAACLAAAIAGYQAARLWCADPSIPPAHLVRLKAALLSGGLIARDVPYESVIVDRFAREVMAAATDP